MSTPNITEAEIEEIKDSLRRCAPETIEAAIAYRGAKDVSKVPEVVTGIIERFLEPDLKPLIRKGDDSLQLFDELGVDSLTMMEIVILVEEVLLISVENEELRDLRSIGDIKEFIHNKLGGETGDSEEASDEYPISKQEVLDTMRHHPPFLFIDQAQIDNHGGKATYKITGNEDFLKGHFPDELIFPASISLEALGQVGVLWLQKADKKVVGGKVDQKSIYFTSCDGIRCHKECKQGDMFEMSVKLKRLRHPMATFEGQIIVDDQKVVYAEEITLLFDYVK